jgi:hypothetical protein
VTSESHPEARQEGPGAISQVPIACTLSQESASDRVLERRAALSATVTDVSWRGPRELRLRLNAGTNEIASLVLVARQEKGCCPSFSFTVQVEANWVTFVIEAPAGAEGALDGFARLPRAG